LAARAPSRSDLDALLTFGGFPELPFAQSHTERRIWERDRLSRVVREDLRDLERVREVSLVKHLIGLLPARVGSPLSVQSLYEDLQVDRKTAERWLHILECLYVCFRLSPNGPPRVRAVKKELRLYLWDRASVEEPGPRSENPVASEPLKYRHRTDHRAAVRAALRGVRAAVGRAIARRPGRRRGRVE